MHKYIALYLSILYIALYNHILYNYNGGDLMGNKYTEAQKKATLKYQADTVSIQIRVKPEQREKYKALALSKGLSLTQLIVKLLEDAN